MMNLECMSPRYEFCGGRRCRRGCGLTSRTITTTTTTITNTTTSTDNVEW